MPSKPLFGSPVAVGISDAVMAMRSVVSAVAEWDDSSAVSERNRAGSLANGHDLSPSDDRKIRVWDQEIGANFRPANFRN